MAMDLGVPFSGTFSDGAKIGYREGTSKAGLKVAPVVDAHTKLFMNFDEQYNQSPYPVADLAGGKTVTVSNAAVVKSPRLFGHAADGVLQVSGVAGAMGYLSLPDSGDWDLTGANVGGFRFKLYIAVLPASGQYPLLIGQQESATDYSGNDWALNLNPLGAGLSLGQPGIYALTTSGITFAAGQWYDIEVSKASNGYTHMFVNGVLRARGNDSRTWAVSTLTLRIGACNSTQFGLTGYYDEIQWIKGSELHVGTSVGTAYFTPQSAATPVYSTAGETAACTEIDLGETKTLNYSDIRVPSNTLASASDVKLEITLDRGAPSAWTSLVTGGAYDTDKAYPPNITGTFAARYIGLRTQLNSNGLTYQEAGRPEVLGVPMGESPDYPDQADTRAGVVYGHGNMVGTMRTGFVSDVEVLEMTEEYEVIEI